ncbi:MAG: zinc-binding dehydrogenase [Actinomycetota bacterium]|nr:zinc-binding dehydrogenase [Actinomycetota bacterium]
MRAAWYERGGPASEVLTVGEMEDPRPRAGEVLVRVRASGVNPGEVKKRADWMGFGIGYPRVIPHSDGAGTIEEVGEGVSPSRIGERVWVWGAQSGRPFGTAAQYVALPSEQAIPLPEGVSFEVGACLEAGALHPRIALRLPLERIAEAHEAVEGGRSGGRVILDID